MDVAISNQCSNIKLVSPVHFTKNAAWYIQFPQEVDSNSIVKVSFIAGIDRDTFGGALLYNLQQKEDESIST
jgi:hypothetical protein